ncbi:MAG: FkbM family methyltransferase [Candidatus Omnitrophota bacterium]
MSIVKNLGMYKFLQSFFQRLPQRIPLVFKAVLPKPIYGLCNDYWMEFDLDEEIQRKIYLARYEPVQSRWVRDILKPGGAFLDVGANVGYYTTLAASLVGNKGRVVAFEPSPYAHNRLLSVLKQNHITQVNAFQCAVGDKKERRELYLPNHIYLHSPSLIPSNGSFTSVKVEVCCLDSHPSLQSVPAIDLMKVDVEGFEPNVFRGMSKLLREGYVKYLMCEFNSGWLEPNGSSCEELLTIIKDMGFVVHKEDAKVTSVGDKGLIYQCQDVLFKHKSTSPTWT